MFSYKDITDDMDLTKVLMRDPEHFKALLSKTPDARVITSKRIDVLFPESYIQKDLCRVNQNISVLGMLCLIDPEAMKYSFMKLPAMVSIPITEMNDVIYRESKYKVLSFNKSETVLENTLVIQDDKLDYFIYDYFVALARVPWYMNYHDLCTLLDNDIYYVGKWIGDSSQLVEMIFGNVGRNPDNDTQMFRSVVKSQDDMRKRMPVWVPLKNITLGSVDTLSKVMGSYYDDGLTSALTEESKKLTNVEKVLRA